MVGILTFQWADDYGAMLQAYGLKRRLELMGEQAEMIPYAPIKLTGRYWFCPCRVKPRGKRMHYHFYRSMLKQNLKLGMSFWKRRWCMRAFRQSYLTAEPPIRRVDKIPLSKYKTVFVGSDQVWNPNITAGLDDAYTGNVPGRGDCRLVSYAASFGGAVLPEDQERVLLERMGNFSALSIREQTAAARIERLLGRKVYDVLDPVLLLERSEWERLACPPVEEGYILLYLTEVSEPLAGCARALAARLGKKIISVSQQVPAWGADAAKVNQDVDIRIETGPAEFLGYVQNAYCVLTNSFHGTVCSVLMEKRFLTFQRSELNLRMEDLLRKLDLTSHLVQACRPDEALELWAHTDWETVGARLRGERERSEQFIRENI